MKVLVTGGSGFIGSHIADALVKEGHQVTVLDNSIQESLPKEAKFVLCDISKDKKTLTQVIQDADIIFHEASVISVAQSMYEIERYVNNNICGTSVLLDCLANAKNNVKKLVIASSTVEYGEGKYECPKCGVVYPGLRTEEQLKKRIWEHLCPNCKSILKPLPINESQTLNPTSIYAVTKRTQEEMSLLIGKTYGIPVVSLRYFNVYGPRQSLNNPYAGVVPIFSSRILNKKPPVVFEDGLQTRDFINVRDVVAANLLAMKSTNANYEIFNVGSGKPITVLKVAEMLIKKYDSNVNPEITGQFRKGDIRHCCADISKIKNKLGFEPKINFENGINDVIAWTKTQKADDSFEKARKEFEEKNLFV